MYRFHLYDDLPVPMDSQAAPPTQPGTEMLDGVAPDVALEERKFRLAGALMRRNMRLCADWLPLGKGSYARRLSPQWRYSSRDASMHRIWFLDECLPRDHATGNGVVVNIYDRSAAVSLPLWWGAEKRGAAWAEAWLYLEVLQQAGGLQVFDPQVSRWISLAADWEVALAAYNATAEQAERQLWRRRHEHKHRRKPWRRGSRNG